jgi:peptidoglycan/LPS O-acetylase OafA/YrhL
MLLLTWRPGRVIFLIVMIVLAVLIGEGRLSDLEPVPPTENARFLLPMGSYAAILIGSLLSISLHHPKGFATLWAILRVRRSPLVLVAALFALWQWLPQYLPGLPNLAMHGVMALILAALVVREDNVLAPVLTWKPVARIGVISYGLYLWHLIGLHIGNEVTGLLGVSGRTAGWVALPIYLAASIAIAEVSFRGFESYFLALKSKVKSSAPA